MFTATPGEVKLPAGHPFGIVETRRDGGKWTFSYADVRDARADLPALRAAHVGRTYVPVGFEELQESQ